jgi:uncharacterized protein YceK
MNSLNKRNKMKNKKVFPLLLILILLLSACGSVITSTASNAQSGTTPQAMQLSEKLAIGTLKLEGTANAITTKQAADLLPLWQVYSSLITSDTAAQEEKDALAQQIQETMTSDQINAIDGMNLTQRDVFASMQQLGITTTSQVSANGTPQPNNGGFPGGGQFFGGEGGGNFTGGGNRNGGGGGGGFGGNGTQLTPQQIATAQARRAANGGGFNSNRILTPLVNAVIKLLESKS